jgi:hypothetical protein
MTQGNFCNTLLQQWESRSLLERTDATMRIKTSVKYIVAPMATKVTVEHCHNSVKGRESQQ